MLSMIDVDENWLVSYCQLKIVFEETNENDRAKYRGRENIRAEKERKRVLVSRRSHVHKYNLG